VVIGIDARFYNEAGPGRYVKNLLKYLQEIDTRNDYLVFLKGSNFSEFIPTNPHFQKCLAPYHWYTFAEQLFFPIKMYRQKIDLMHFTQFNVPLLWLGKYVVTIHDMIIHEFSLEKESFIKKIVYRLKKPIFFLIFSLACRRAAHILVPSQATKKDLVEKLKINPDKITVTPEGVDEVFQVQSSKFNPSTGSGLTLSEVERVKVQNYEEDKVS
jgi:glycosyltransferase involved in cell wall biosynthesis